MISEQEQERFMRLWTDAQPAVVNYLHAMVRDPAMAKDLVQETAMVLFRRFARHEKRRGAGRAATHPRTTPRLHRATNAPGKAVGMSDPQKLIAAYLDDALSDADRDELVAWLKGPADHLRAFVEANLFEQQIRQAVHGQVQREAAMHFAETDQINLVDLGTTFGIDATHGRTEVHVFKGKVELLTGTAAKQALGQGQAARAEGNAPLRLMAASATAFTPMFQLQQRSLDEFALFNRALTDAQVRELYTTGKPDE